MLSLACSGAQACGQVLAAGAVRPAPPIQSWLASLAEHLARYDKQVVSDALKGGVDTRMHFFVAFLCFYAHSTILACFG